MKSAQVPQDLLNPGMGRMHSFKSSEDAAFQLVFLRFRDITCELLPALSAGD